VIANIAHDPLPGPAKFTHTFNHRIISKKNRAKHKKPQLKKFFLDEAKNHDYKTVHHKNNDRSKEKYCRIIHYIAIISSSKRKKNKHENANNNLKNNAHHKKFS
jgi:hypothetical protein